MTTLTRSTALRTQLKERKCIVCKDKFKQQRPMQAVCSPACAAVHSRQEREKKERKEAKERKAKLKTRSDWMKEAQNAFNAYVRRRDQDKPCICCGKPLQGSDIGGQFDCGHYRSVGSAPHLRFDENNAHGQTKQCNRYGAGRAVDYRRGLVARIGTDALEALEADQTPRHYTIEDLKRIKTEYISKLRALKETLCSL